MPAVGWDGVPSGMPHEPQYRALDGLEVPQLEQVIMG
jgi:hypothetical protein